MKQRNRNSQRQGESQRPTPEAMASSLGNRDYGTAGSFHCKPLVSDGNISPWRRFQGGETGEPRYCSRSDGLQEMSDVVDLLEAVEASQKRAA
jgi:hypothetical protein